MTPSRLLRRPISGRRCVDGTAPSAPPTLYLWLQAAASCWQSLCAQVLGFFEGSVPELEVTSIRHVREIFEQMKSLYLAQVRRCMGDGLAQTSRETPNLNMLCTGTSPTAR